MHGAIRGKIVACMRKPEHSLASPQRNVLTRDEIRNAESVAESERGMHVAVLVTPVASECGVADYKIAAHNQ